MSELLNVDAVAKLLSLSKSKVYKLAEERDIPFLKIGGALRFSPASIEKWIEKKVNGR